MSIWVVRPWLVLALLLAAGVFQTNCFVLPLPSDSELAEIFYEHRGAFERLREMAFEDHLEGGIEPYFGRDGNLPRERVNEYRSLMRKAGVEYLISSWKPPSATVQLWIDHRSSVFAGMSKGIAYYAEQPRSPVVPSLDVSCNPSPVCIGLMHIEENWWLIRAEDD